MGITRVEPPLRIETTIRKLRVHRVEASTTQIWVRKKELARHIQDCQKIIELIDKTTDIG